MSIANAAHHSMIGGGKTPTVLKTLNLNSASISALSCSVNGLTNATLFAWAKNLPYFARSPAWAETGGWGATYFGMNVNTIEVRFGSGNSNSKKQFTYTQPADEWHHYCFVRELNGSTGNYRFYLDGQLRASQTGGTIAMKNNSTNFTLASGMNGQTVNTDGSIVAYGVFSRALSDGEVAQMYAEKIIDLTKQPFNSGLLMGMNVTEGEGNKIFDLVSGHYVTISSTPNWNVDFPL